jgi:hypothetical protein
MMTVNDNSRVVNKLEASLTEDAGVVIYDHHMFIVQATDPTIVNWTQPYLMKLYDFLLPII